MSLDGLQNGQYISMAFLLLLLLFDRVKIEVSSKVPFPGMSKSAYREFICWKGYSQCITTVYIVPLQLQCPASPKKAQVVNFSDFHSTCPMGHLCQTLDAPLNMSNQNYTIEFAVSGGKNYFCLPSRPIGKAKCCSLRYRRRFRAVSLVLSRKGFHLPVPFFLSRVQVLNWTSWFTVISPTPPSSAGTWSTYLPPDSSFIPPASPL